MMAESLRESINRHDLDAFVACFDADYRSEQPAHPARTFRGRDQVRKNWSTFFQAIPDRQSELLASTKTGDVEWAEWRWHGTRASGDRFEMRGVTLMGMRTNIVWRRLYMEEIEGADEEIDRAVQRLASGDTATG